MGREGRFRIAMLGSRAFFLRFPERWPRRRELIGKRARNRRTLDMATAPLSALLRHIERLAARGGTELRTDRQLLDAFAARHDEAAFAALVARHGPMVLRVCRRVLHHEQDAEDAFQATFLVLAQAALSIRRREAVAGWLHGVAYRPAMK